MIPKIIHYCWFGKGQKSELAIKCINSWHKLLPEYKLIEWNEESFSIRKANRFVREAYRIGKYAFVADYVRLYALYNYGGIYFDTDVEVIKPFDAFLDNPAFIGYEDNRKFICLQTGVIGAEIHNPLIGEFIEYYSNQVFILPDKSYNTRTNVDIITSILRDKGLVLNGKFCRFNNQICVYPKDFFCPKDPDNHVNLTENSVCIHYYSGSWCYVIPKKHIWIANIIGERRYIKLGKTFQKIKKIFKRF
jgi:hypothetical protein